MLPIRGSPENIIRENNIKPNTIYIQRFFLLSIVILLIGYNEQINYKLYCVINFVFMTIVYSSRRGRFILGDASRLNFCPASYSNFDKSKISRLFYTLIFVSAFE